VVQGSGQKGYKLQRPFGQRHARAKKSPRSFLRPVPFPGADLEEILPGVNAGVVAVVPVELEGVAADLAEVFQVELGIVGVGVGPHVGRAAHVGMAPLTFHAGTYGPQAGKGVGAGTAVIPFNRHCFLIAIGSDAGWSWFTHENS
jgi:hypothetical protein